MKFLVVDPSRSVHAFLGLIAKDLDFEGVYSCVDAINELQSKNYDLILFDWSIEDKHMLLEFSDYPVTRIAMTSTIKRSQINNIMLSSVDGLLSKPFTKERFNDCILYNRHLDPEANKSPQVQDQNSDNLVPIRVLFCEDDEQMRDIIEADLDDLGNYQATFACDGLEGADLLENEQFDVLITDIDMPGLSGIDLIKKVRKSNKNAHIPIFIFSGAVDSQVEQFAEEYVIKIFYKPFDITEILRTIHNKIFPARTIPSYHSSLVDYWYETVNEVLASNLGDCTFGTLEVVESSVFQAYISSSIGMVGKSINGRIHLFCDYKFCQDFLQHVFHENYENEVNRIEEFIGELNNQLAGRLKLKLEAHGIALQITVPSTHFGKEDVTKELEQNKVLLLNGHSKTGRCQILISMSKISDEIFGHKTKTVVLEGGLFF
ncbi:response regulator [Pseudobacteriovorax antillogorgiicola]|uniref:Chemotaxis phosphatase CheX n=1 Tax=Pseudobacteriovorax antillogorgiicola TaxID=1513793 RepID=A0A1Y6CFL8_9BACT|nr:response regulator [Pseudobacteriovorax antillogorgiicola]TCS49052.1 chemotaxis phosphatase CheX-like protein [Pseudobacteriovorax antillogorgiicola]SMF52502.1 Chemotaxis phosphatase CheX [Pseudobacteriovorax antillogorgiicola]